MAEPTPHQHRATAKIARITAALAALVFVGLLVSYLLRDEPIPTYLFGFLIAVGGLLAGAAGSEKKAEEAEARQHPPSAP